MAPPPPPGGGSNMWVNFEQNYLKVWHTIYGACGILDNTLLAFTWYGFLKFFEQILTL